MRLKTVFALVLCAVLTFMLPTTVYAATNELTGLEVSDGIAGQRPVAIMVDNEKKAGRIIIGCHHDCRCVNDRGYGGRECRKRISC